MNFLQTITHNRSRALLLLSLFLATGLSLWNSWAALHDAYAFQDDFRNIYWMHRFRDASLFPNDPLIGNSIVNIQMGSRELMIDISRPGYSLLFYLGSFFFDIVFLHKLLVFPLVLFSVYYLYRIGEIIKGSGTGFALALVFVVLNLASFSDISVSGGIPRSFAAPLLLALSYYLMVDRTASAIVVLIISGLIYLPIFLLGLVTYGLGALESVSRKWPFFRIRWKQIAPLIVILIVAGLLFWPLLNERLDSLTNVFLNQDAPTSIVGDPSFGSEGRWNLFNFFPFWGLGGFFSKSGAAWQSFSLVVLSLALWIQVPDSVKRYPKTLKLLLLASFLLFGLAWIFILVASSRTLYFPSRYTRMSLFLVLLIFVIVNLEEGVNVAVGRLRFLQTWQKGLILSLLILIGVVMITLFKDDSLTILRRMPGGDYSYTFIGTTLLLVASLLIAVFSTSDTTNKYAGTTGKISPLTWLALGIVLIMVSYFFIPRNREDFKYIDPAGQRVLVAIEELPVDVVLSGEPGWLSYIPLLSKRMVLRSSEHFNSGTDATMLASLEAYFSESFSGVVDFCQAYGVDYMIAATWTLNEDHIRNGRLFFEPYNSLIREEISEQTHFALREVPEKAQLVNVDGLIVFQCLPELLLDETG